MIGIFDSGLGGMQSLQYIRDILPQYTYIYLGDTKYVPYGDKSPEFLRERTFQCLERLFEQGCTLVILACNTASAYAIRARQEQWPEKKVLSVTMPGIEAIVEGGYHEVGLLATTATLQSNLYPELLYRHFPDYPVTFTSYNGAGLVDLLESGAEKAAIMTKLDQIFGSTPSLGDVLVLGSTHYPLLIPYLQELVGEITFINPAWEAAKKLPIYLARHPEIVLEQDTAITLYVTSNVPKQQYGGVEQIDL